MPSEIKLNHRLDLLQPYPFTRLAALLDGLSPAGKNAIRLTIGEPRHPAPDFVAEIIANNLDGLSRYPATGGTTTLKSAIADWATRRYKLPDGMLDPGSMVLPVLGTREALFAFAQIVFDGNGDELLSMPNPFYQIYEGAALLAGASPHFINEGDNQIDYRSVSADIWQQTKLLYLCSPSNPQGSLLDTEDYRVILELADEYQFVVASDECYSELFYDENQPPPGLLQACAELGRRDFKNCMVFHSLSKRSNLPGLRSGFVAGDPDLIKPFLLYRTYHGSAMSETVQAVSTAAWQDEAHVKVNRQLYRDKFDAVVPLMQSRLNVSTPAAGFYLWPEVPENGEQFAAKLYEQEHVLVMPGSYLTRPTQSCDPGVSHVRLALVDSLDECVSASERIVEFCQRNY